MRVPALSVLRLEQWLLSGKSKPAVHCLTAAHYVIENKIKMRLKLPLWVFKNISIQSIERWWYCMDLDNKNTFIIFICLNKSTKKSKKSSFIRVQPWWIFFEKCGIKMTGNLQWGYNLLYLWSDVSTSGWF